MKPLFYFAFESAYHIISSAPKWRNGRRKRLKIVRVIPWGFESPLGHHLKNTATAKVAVFFVLFEGKEGNWMERGCSVMSK